MRTGYASDLFGDDDSPVGTDSPVALPPVTFPTWTKRRYARPTYFSRVPRGTNIATAVYGAQLLGQQLAPQGEEIAALLNARTATGRRLYEQAVILMSRRTGKTSAIWADLIGDCATTPKRRVFVTAQDGTRIREFLRDEIMGPLSEHGFRDALSNRMINTRELGRLLKGNGGERIEFANGSLLRVVPPKPAIFRSKAADRIFIDEAGEADEGLGSILLAAVLPLMNTRPDPQIIISGTPGGLGEDGQPKLARAGLLWDKYQEAIGA